MASKTYNIRSIKNETAAAIVAEIMQNKYPKVRFESVDTGCGYYDLTVWSDSKDSIHPTTVKSFTREAGAVTEAVVATISILHRQGLVDF